MSSKYWVVVKQAFQESIHFRFELLIWIFLDTLPTLILFFVWQTVFRSSTEINGYTFSGMVEFYFYFLVITNLSSSHFEENHVTNIRKGQIDQYFTKPLSFPQQIFCEYIGSKVFYTLLLIPSLWMIALIAQHFFGVQFSPLNPTKVIEFVVLLLFAFVIEYYLALIIVLLGFWFEKADGLEQFKWLFISLLAGSIIPKVFMPEWLRSIIIHTPFQYMYSVPIDIVQGRYSLHLTELIPVFLFVLTLAFISWTLWQKATYKYTSAGG